jgi:hypothetical protein
MIGTAKRKAEERWTQVGHRASGGPLRCYFVFIRLGAGARDVVARRLPGETGSVDSRVSRSARGQPQHGAAEVVALGEIAIDGNTVDLVVADDRLNELITPMRNVGNPAS